MKKKRYLPFGYRMEKGKVTIIPEESELVQKIFSEYLEGKSLQQLADMVQKTGLSYRENSNGWNKGMIARILDDNRYWNQNGFPSIIAEETARKVIQQKQEKSIPKSQLNFLKGKVICSGCGAALHRDSRSLPKVFWNCKDCGASFGPFTDAGFYQIILEKFQSLYQNPESIETEQIPDNSLPMKVVRLTNEIDRSLDEREIDPERVLSLILECAAEKYNGCQILGSDPETVKIRELLEHSDQDKFDTELFSQIVEQIIPQPDGSVKFRLRNQKII